MGLIFAMPRLSRIPQTPRTRAGRRLRMNEVKYLLDENVDPRLRKAPEQGTPEVTVWAVGAPGEPLGAGPRP